MPPFLPPPQMLLPTAALAAAECASGYCSSDGFFIFITAEIMISSGHYCCSRLLDHDGSTGSSDTILFQMESSATYKDRLIIISIPDTIALEFKNHSLSYLPLSCHSFGLCSIQCNIGIYIYCGHQSDKHHSMLSFCVDQKGGEHHLIS